MSQSMMITQQQQQQQQQQESSSSVRREGSQGGLLFSDEEMDSGMSSGTNTVSRRTRRRVARSTQQEIIGGGADSEAGADSDYASPSSPARFGSVGKSGRGSGESTPVMSPLSRLSPEAGSDVGVGVGGKEGGWRQNFPLSLDDIKIPEGRSSEDLPPRPTATAPSAATSSSVERKEVTPTGGDAAKDGGNA